MLKVKEKKRSIKIFIIRIKKIKTFYYLMLTLQKCNIDDESQNNNENSNTIAVIFRYTIWKKIREDSQKKDKASIFSTKGRIIRTELSEQNIYWKKFSIHSWSTQNLERIGLKKMKCSKLIFRCENGQFYRFLSVLISMCSLFGCAKVKFEYEIEPVEKTILIFQLN